MLNTSAKANRETKNRGQRFRCIIGRSWRTRLLLAACGVAKDEGDRNLCAGSFSIRRRLGQSCDRDAAVGQENEITPIPGHFGGRKNVRQHRQFARIANNIERSPSPCT